MGLEMHPNDIERDAEPSIWIFKGRWAGALPIAVMAGICILILLSRMGFDWGSALAISVFPFGAFGVFIHVFVNGKPPSYALDFFMWHVWRFRSWLYVRGIGDRPPALMIVGPPPRHPREF